MPVAQPFKALGRGNGFPFCLQYATKNEITSVDGLTLSPNNQSILKTRLSSLNESRSVLWNLFSVSFPSIEIGSFTVSFEDGEFGFGAVSDGAVNADALIPIKRTCLQGFDFNLTDRTNDANYWAVAQGNAEGFFTEIARFEIHSVFYATDTNEHYIIYCAGYYSDDNVTLIQDADWGDFNFDFYTYD